MAKLWIPEPDPGMDWLWYHPDAPDMPMGTRMFHCYKCDVTWKQFCDPGIRIKCWCCGQFQKRPNFY